GDIENAQQVSDLDAYGYFGYFIELQDVELNEEGQIVDFTFVYPNEGEALLGGGSLYANGVQATGLSAGGFQVNTFVVDQGVGTSSYVGALTFAEGEAEVEYDGDVEFFTYLPEQTTSSNSVFT